MGNPPKQDKKDDLIDLINTRIENLRPKLLDLTRRNPLLSTKFSDRSHSHIRIVDELPQVLFNGINEDKMKFISLPPLEADPKDEDNPEFQGMLSDARLTDEVYINYLESIDQDAEDSAEKLTIAERELKDRIRVEMEMPERQTRKTLSLVQHARNNHILPSYDLPLPADGNLKSNHQDEKIQTLLLPDMLEKRVNSIMYKCNTWVEETGINVLRAAFGFLEWNESATSQSALAPIILLAVTIEKKKAREGFEYIISGLGEAPELNTVLVEKLKREFGIELPAFNSEELLLEDYFHQVSAIVSKRIKGMTWRIRRQVAVGIFPSARMAMYHDLDTASWKFANHEVIKQLLGGKSSTSGATPFGEEYEVDAPHIEQKVPLIVTDADASQFSAIVDVMDDKNIAVEGPPGSGKSQTIVNTIAVALSHGKKVLFVAEKTAALEVVRSRLAACGLGEFLLTLQATRSTKEKVMKSIRDRLDLSAERTPLGLDEKIAQFKSIRAQLSEYIQTISEIFAQTDFTVHHILGRGMEAQKKLIDHLNDVGHIHISNVNKLSQENINEIAHFCNQLEVAWGKAALQKHYWREVRRANIDPYSADEILNVAKECAKCCEENYVKRKMLGTLGVHVEVDAKELIALKTVMGELEKISEKIDVQLLSRILEGNAFIELVQFFKKLEESGKLKASLSEIVTDPLNIDVPAVLRRLAKAMEAMSLSTPSIESAEQILSLVSQKLAFYKEQIKKLEEVIKVVDFIKERPASTIVALCDAKQNISKRMLSLRSPKFEAPDTRELISRASKRAQTLLDQKATLKKKFSLIGQFGSDELALNVSILTEAGFFYFISPKFYKAKKFYLSICDEKSFERNKAVMSLREVIQWQDAYKAFNEEAGLKELLGIYFNGCETDFLMFVELIDFYDRIDTNLNGIDNSPCREFLKKGDIDLILALPEFLPDDSLRLEKRNYSQLLENIAAGERKFEITQEFVEDIKRGLAYIKKTRDIGSDNLKEIAKDILNFQSTWKILDEDRRIQNILGQHFKGVQTTESTIKESLLAATKVTDLEKSMQQVSFDILEKKQIKVALQKLDEVVDVDKSKAEIIARLTGATSIEKEKILGALNGQELAEFWSEASTDKKGLLAHSVVYANKKELSLKGCGETIDALTKSKHGLQNLAEIMSAVISKSLIKEVYKKYGDVLAKYDGNKLNHLRTRLAELDKQIIDLSRKKLRVDLRRRANAPEGVGEGRRGEWTEMSLLQNEVAKKKRHIPVRDLTSRAGKSLLEIKPCWMMSPLAVAQYIAKGSIEFDLVIIDEASQMTPEDSLGALVRCKKAMIVGDTNQLPPTPFFKKVLDDIEEDEDEVVSEESILEMANAVFRPARRLKWHYRSRHPGLIAFSNKYVYDSDLTIFPSPDTHNPDRGVFFNQVKGFYSNGTNPIEASEIVQAAINFMHKSKDMSLGIVLLNQKQQELVQEQMDYALAHDPIAQEYIEKWQSSNVRDGLEKFFVKNLENVQGDERDVIFIGTVYGREKDGAPVMQRFGPINGVAGKRRLNVLFSRAKCKIVTFSSMTSSDVKVDTSSNEGLVLFKAWLEYSATGQLLLEGKVANKETGSIFEDFVIAQLKSIGCEPVPQVGVSGYFIDIGVRHPNWPHGFIMGIECDGRTYHSSKSARERDRLRQEVLTGLEWNLYRIWSTDWFNDPIYESKKLREVIEKRLEDLKRA